MMLLGDGTGSVLSYVDSFSIMPCRLSAGILLDLS